MPNDELENGLENGPETGFEFEEGDFILPPGNKHYVRLDQNGAIIKGFSDAFNEPIDTDICINEDGGRHFELNGEVNPPLFNRSGQPLYFYTEDGPVELTEEDWDTLYPIPAPAPTEIEILKEENKQLKADNLLALTATAELYEMILMFMPME